MPRCTTAKTQMRLSMRCCRTQQSLDRQSQYRLWLLHVPRKAGLNRTIVRGVSCGRRLLRSRTRVKSRRASLISAVLAALAILPAQPGSNMAGATTPVVAHEAAQLKGSWSLQPVPAPAKARSTGLGAVSCPSADTCSAVGAYTGTNGTAVAMAEDWTESSGLSSPLSP